MSETVKVVRIVSTDPETNGFVEINEADFDPVKHIAFDANKPVKTTPANVGKKAKE